MREFLWDLDGTLLDTYPAMVRAFQQAVAEHKVKTVAHIVFADVFSDDDIVGKLKVDTIAHMANVVPCNFYITTVPKMNSVS